MKKSLFLYLFIIAALMNIFTFMYFSKKSESDKAHSLKISKSSRDSLAGAILQLDEANYFDLANNQNAQNYFASGLSDTNMAIEKLIPHVKDKLMEYNDLPEGNPYTGQTQIGAKKFIINKSKVLNHRWIVADYSDGEYWGEVLLKYFVNKDDTVEFEVIQSLIYQK